MKTSRWLLVGFALMTAGGLSALAGGGGAPVTPPTPPRPAITPAPAPVKPRAPTTPATTAASAATSTTTSTSAAITAVAPTLPVNPLIEHPGWTLAAACFACHGLDGKDETFGALNVFSAEDFIDRMNELKTTEAENEGLMKPHSVGYTDEQIKLLADYFSQVE